MTTEAEITVERPREEVFDAYIRDDALVAFCRKVGPFAAIDELTTHGEMKAGARRSVRMSDGLELEEIIADHVHPSVHAYGWRDPAGPLGALVRKADAEWRFEPHGGGTRIVWQYAFTLRSPLLWPVGRLVASGFRRWMQAALERGKTAIEKG